MQVTSGLARDSSHNPSLRVRERVPRICHPRTGSYYMPVVNDQSQRIPCVLYAHGNCGSRVRMLITVMRMLMDVTSPEVHLE